MALSVSIKVLRQKSLMSQMTFAKELNVSPTTVNRWETGKVKPNLTAMKAIKTFCERNGYSYSDIENEHKIQLALQNLLKGKTTIMIAHRLHTIRDADKIVVFQDGTVAEQGTHQELVKKGGVYGRMWEIYTQATIGKEAV